ncbi:MAG: winged helix-turn-helix transcriptional regulator [Limisphaerales bacterium]
MPVRPLSCEMERLLGLIGGRWTVLILRELFGGERRPSALRAALPGISQKMLTQRLRGLERAGVVARRVRASARPHVEYALTPFGRELRRIVLAMHRWAARHAERLDG